MKINLFSVTKQLGHLLLAALVSFTVCIAIAQAQAPLTGDQVATSQGDLIVHPVKHASFVMQWNGVTVYVDPAGGAEPYGGLPGPDIVLITDIHADHLDADTLAGMQGTAIVAPQAVYDKAPDNIKGAITTILKNGDEVTVDGIGIEAIPMYNITEGRLQYHEKGRGNGYLLTLGDERVYIAGDTEAIPEMLALKDIDVAFIPMNLPYTMTVEQAAEAVRTFKPAIVYPYHYRGSDVEEFKRLVGDASEVRLLEWY